MTETLRSVHMSACWRSFIRCPRTADFAGRTQVYSRRLGNISTINAAIPGVSSEMVPFEEVSTLYSSVACVTVFRVSQLEWYRARTSSER